MAYYVMFICYNSGIYTVKTYEMKNKYLKVFEKSDLEEFTLRWNASKYF